MNAPLPLSNGDIVQLEHDGVRVSAKVMLVSPDGRSILVSFDDLFAHHVYGMALLFTDGDYRAIANNQPTTSPEDPFND